MQLLQTHPYLFYSLVGVALAGMVCLLLPRRRRDLLCSGLTSAPGALLSIYFIPAYWQPRQVFHFLIGPEDLLFSFAAGIIVWALVAPAAPNLPRSLDWRLATRRYFLVACSFFTFWLLLWHIGLRVMDAACVAALLLLAFLLWRTPTAWRLALHGGVLFGTAYALTVVAIFTAAPFFLEQWQGSALSGLQLGPAPAEEVWWGLTYGAVWPPLLLFVWGRPELGEDLARDNG